MTAITRCTATFFDALDILQSRVYNVYVKLLGALEELIMLGIRALSEEDASAVAIRRLIKERTGKEVSAGALYTTLQRLEQKGMIDSKEVPGDAARRGIPKSTYRLLGTGDLALAETDQAKSAMRRPGYA